MSFINQIFAGLIGALLAPFSNLAPWVGLAVVSALAGVLALLVYKYTSNQKKIAAVKDQIVANLFEIRLFRDDLRAVFRAQGEILLHNARYLSLNLVPFLVLMVPFVFIIAQLQAEYGYAPLTPGEGTLLTVKVDDTVGIDRKPDVSLQAPAGVTVETSGVWIPSQREMVWRVSTERPGDFELTLTSGGEDYVKRLRSSELQQRRSPVRQTPQFLGQLLYPAESTLPSSSPIESITIGYPVRSIGLLGLELNWIFWFFIMSIVAGFALRGPMKVTI